VTPGGAARYNRAGSPTMTIATDALTVQFLAWVAERPRTRAEVMEAWRSTCPHLSIWEDANIDGLVRFENGKVTLTERGRTLLERAPHPH
jgi:hypothetical protein